MAGASGLTVPCEILGDGVAEVWEVVMPVPVAAVEVNLAAGFGVPETEPFPGFAEVAADPLAVAVAGGLAFTLELPVRLADPD